MDHIEQIKARRLQLLNKLYEVTGGNCRVHVSLWKLGDELGFDHEQTTMAYDYLKEEDLLIPVALGGEISLTHFGLKEIERALSAPNQPTTYFPPVVNILHVQSMIGSQIQQGTHGSTQSLVWTQPQIDSIREFLSTLKQQLPEVRLSAQNQNDVAAEVSTIEAQLTSSKPKPGIISESLQSVRTILEGAAGDLVASSLLPSLIHLISTLVNS